MLRPAQQDVLVQLKTFFPVLSTESKVEVVVQWQNHTLSATYYQKAVDQRPYAIEPPVGLLKPLDARGELEKMLGLYLAILQVDAQNTQTHY